MSRLKSVITGILLLAGTLASGHPLHLTFTNMEFNTSNHRWTIVIKVFSDDFATNLNMETGADMAIDQKTRRGDADPVLKKWFGDRFRIWFDSKPVGAENWKLESIEVKEAATWLTYSFTAPLPTREIKVRNTLLFDLYGDQKNLFVLTMGQFQSAFEFKNKKEETVIKLSK
jgi:hypothetical protein